MKLHTIVLTTAIVVLPLVAWGQEDATSWFDKGKEHMKAGEADEACDAFERSLALEASLKTHFQLGKCNEARGQFFSAYHSYLKAAGMAEEAGDTQRQQVAQARAEALEPKLPGLSLEVSAALRKISGLTIVVDGKRIDDDDWDARLTLDPGEHTIVVSAPAHRDTTQKVTVVADGVTSVTVKPPQTGPAPPPGYGGEDEGPKTRRKSTGLMWAGIGGIALGGIATIIGTLGIAIDQTSCTRCEFPGGMFAVTLIGVSFLGAGIPLVAIYGEEVPVAGEGDGEAPPEPPQDAIITPLLGPTSVGLSVQF